MNRIGSRWEGEEGGGGGGGGGEKGGRDTYVDASLLVSDSRLRRRPPPSGPPADHVLDALHRGGVHGPHRVLLLGVHLVHLDAPAATVWSGVWHTHTHTISS